MTVLIGSIIALILGALVGRKLYSHEIEHEREVKGMLKRYDLQERDLEASRKLYEVDPAFAIELGYESPKQLFVEDRKADREIYIRQMLNMQTAVPRCPLCKQEGRGPCHLDCPRP